MSDNQTASDQRTKSGNLSEQSSRDDSFRIVSLIVIPLTVALIGYLGVRITVYAPIWATQTAQMQTIFFTQTAFADRTLPVTSSTPFSPTDTPQPTITSTPEVVFSPTPTLDAHVRFILPQKDELDKIPTILGYEDVWTPKTTLNYRSVHANESFFWTYRWCGRYQDNLDEFLSHTTFQFLVDDTDVSQSNFLIQQYMSTNNWSCQRWTTLLTNWKAGYKVTLTIVYTISRPVSDGDKIYQPGDYRHDLLVTIKP